MVASCTLSMMPSPFGDPFGGVGAAFFDAFKSDGSLDGRPVSHCSPAPMMPSLQKLGT